MPTLTKFLGRNGFIAPTDINDAEAVKCQNLFLSGHSLLLRGGNSLAFTDALDTTDAINGLHRSYINGAFWAYSVGSTVRSTQTGVQATIKTLSAANKMVEFVDGGGKLYILPNNTTDKVQQSDGTAGGTIDHPSAVCPRSGVGCYANGRLFLQDLNNLNKLWFSDQNDTTTFRDQSSSTVATDGGWILVGTGDGDGINAVVQAGSPVFIFKERSVWQLTGTSFTGSNAFVLTQMTSKMPIGTKSPRSVKATEMGFIFLDSDGRMRYYWGFARQFFSEFGRHMEDLTLAIPSGSLVNAAAGYFGRRYFISFQSAGGSINDTTFALDLRLAHPTMGYWVDTEMPSAWTEITGNAWTVLEVSGGRGDPSNLYYADATANGKVWQFLTGTTDNGAAIPYAWTSKAYGGDQPKVVKSLSEFTTATRTASAVVNHNAYVDLASTATATKALTPLNTKYSVNTWRCGETVRGSTIQVGVNGSSSVGGEILAMEFDWSPRRVEPVQG